MFIASTLIIILCIVYFTFPHIAQNGIKNPTIEIQSLTLSNPSATSFHLQQIAKFTNHNKYHPKLNAFNASLSVGGAEDKPYAYIQLPAVHATETTYTNIDQEVQITDMDAFINYNTQLLTQESVDPVVKGRTNLHEGCLPATTVDYHKTITISGKLILETKTKTPNHLPNPTIPLFSILLTPSPSSANLRAQVLIPKPVHSPSTWAT
ncbi:MAG: hypothetical protein L6R42_008741 [Xanthoria sp. 1 TBL-2021]|nr:MAG: hypothetical protein L6R42_008741 [Xanthoria sp. 1 TBL-2021]